MEVAADGSANANAAAAPTAGESFEDRFDTEDPFYEPRSESRSSLLSLFAFVLENAL